MLVFGMRCVGMGAEMQALSNSAALIKAKSGLLEMSELMTLSAEMTRAGDPDAAIKLYRAWILTPLPDQAGFVFVALFNLGVTLGSKGDDAGAEQAYRDAIAVNPEFLEARCLSAKADLPRPSTAGGNWLTHRSRCCPHSRTCC